MPTKNVYARASTCNVNDNNQFLSSLETERSTTTATTSKSEEKKNETQQCIIASHLEHYTSSHTLYSRHIFLKRFFRSLFVGHFIVKIPFLWTFFPFVHHFFHSWMVLSSNDSNSDTWKCNFLAGRNALCVAQVRFMPSLLLVFFFIPVPHACVLVGSFVCRVFFRYFGAADTRNHEQWQRDEFLTWNNLWVVVCIKTLWWLQLVKIHDSESNIMHSLCLCLVIPFLDVLIWCTFLYTSLNSMSFFFSPSLAFVSHIHYMSIFV